MNRVFNYFNRNTLFQKRSIFFLLSILFCFLINFDKIQNRIPKIISEKPIKQDPAGYIKIAYNLVNYGIISVDNEKDPNLIRPTNYREPAYPIYLALGMYAIGSYEGFPLNRLLKGENSKSLLKFQILLVTLTCITAAIILLVLTNNFWSFVLLCSLITYYLHYSKYVAYFLSESLAAFLVTSLTLFFILITKYNKSILYIFSGILLACLTLTKAIYAYMWPFALIFFYFIWKKKQTGYRYLFHSFILFLIPFFFITGSWIMRNYIQLNRFAITDGRDGKILSIRSYINEMTLPEGFAHFFTCSSFMKEHPETFKKLFPDKIFYEKVMNDTYRNEYRKHKLIIYEKFGFEKGNTILKKEGAKKIFSKPFRHLLVSIPIMFRMVCAHKIFPLVLPKSIYGKLIFRTYFEPIFIIISIIFLLFFSIIRYRLDIISILFPIIYSIGIYGIISNGLPRYLVPIEPLFFIILLLTTRTIIITLFKRIILIGELKRKISHKCLKCNLLIKGHPQLKLCKNCVNKIIADGLNEDTLSELYGLIAKREDIPSTANSSYTFDSYIYEWINKNIDKESTILEIGSGGGFFAEYLRKNGFKNVTASEYNDNAVENIKKRFPELQYRIIDACKIPLNDSSIDLVISIEVIEHLLHPEKHFKEVKRILKPGGQYIIRTPNKIIERLYYKCIGRYDIVIWHPSSFTLCRLKRQLKKLNFDIEILSINSLPISQLNKIPSILRSIIKKISPSWIPPIFRPSLICIARLVD